MKKNLLWLALAVFLTTLCVPPTMMADGNLPPVPPVKKIVLS